MNDNTPLDNKRTGDNDERNRFMDYCRDITRKTAVVCDMRVPDLRIAEIVIWCALRTRVYIWDI